MQNPIFYEFAGCFDLLKTDFIKFIDDIFIVDLTLQGRKWRVGRVGNCPLKFW